MKRYPMFEVIEQVKIKGFYSFFEHHYKNGYRFSGEMHNFWECVYVEQGEICAIADENVYDLSAGEMIVHKPLEFHGFFITCPEGAHVKIISFAMEGDLDNRLKDKVFRLDGLQKQLVCSMYDLAAKEHEAIFGIPAEQPVFWGTKYPDLFQVKPEILPMLAAILSQLLLSLSGAAAKHHTSGAPDADIFRVAVDHMSTNVDKPITVEDIARVAGVSTASLHRIFRKYAQMSVHKYFLLLKIKIATQLLQSGITVNETHRRLGFSTQSYFSACYKRETGMNPSEVVKKSRQE